MISRSAFNNLLLSIENYQAGLSNLETSLNTMFDDNFLTNIFDNLLSSIAESFFTDEELDDDNTCFTVSTVVDILYHYCFTCDFGLKRDKLIRLYVEDEGLETEESFDACTAEQLYNLINRYIHPIETKKTYLINC